MPSFHPLTGKPPASPADMRNQLPKLWAQPTGSRPGRPGVCTKYQIPETWDGRQPLQPDESTKAHPETGSPVGSSGCQAVDVAVECHVLTKRAITTTYFLHTGQMVCVSLCVCVLVGTYWISKLSESDWSPNHFFFFFFLLGMVTCSWCAVVPFLNRHTLRFFSFIV